MDETQLLEELNKILGRNSKELGALIREIKQRVGRGESSAELQRALAKLKANTVNLSNANKKQVEQIEKLEKSIEQTEKAFKKVKGTIGDVGDTLFKLGDAGVRGAEQISFYASSVKNFPILGAAINDLGSSLDFNINNFRALASIGADFNQSLVGLRIAARDARLPLLEFTDFIAGNNEVLAGLFGDATTGAIQIGRLASQVRDNLIPQFAGLGITTENYLDFFSTFLDLQRAQARQDFTSQELTTQALQNYTAELDQVAKLTGIQREQLDASVRAQKADAVFSTFLQGLEKTRADQLQIFTAGLDNINPALGSAVKNILATGFPLGEFEQTLVGTTDGLLDNVLALREGQISTAQFAKILEQGGDTFLNSFDPAVLRAAGNVGEVGNALISVRGRFGDLESIIRQQEAAGDALTKQIGVTQEGFRVFKSQIEGLQTNFLQQFGPGLASFLGGTDATLKKVGSGIETFVNAAPRTAALAFAGAMGLKYTANFAKEVGIVAAGVQIGNAKMLTGPLRLIGRGLGFIGRALPALGAIVGVGTSLSMLADEDKANDAVGAGGLAGAAAGAGLGFLAGGPIGALIGAGLGSLVGQGLGGLTQRQFGGNLATGQPALVGERGPELFLPNTAGNVEPMIIKTASTGVTAEPIGGGSLSELTSLQTQQNNNMKAFTEVSNKMEKHLNTLVKISAKTEKNTENSTRKLANLNSNLV
tara:strand:- start:1551 stop:3677 length:2127 start_codon:yes stop_codon:yes gene_type:complete